VRQGEAVAVFIASGGAPDGWPIRQVAVTGQP